jgi:hypothetical protein
LNDERVIEVGSDFSTNIKGNEGAFLEEGVVARALHYAIKKYRDKHWMIQWRELRRFILVLRTLLEVS